MHIYLSTLGCVRNQVDSEVITGRLKAAGHVFTDGPQKAEAIIVNTCAFIQTASEQTIEEILDLASYKQQGECKKLIVLGCLPQRYGKDSAKALPEVDLFLGTGAYDLIEQALEENTGFKENCILPPPEQTALPAWNTARSYNTWPVAYVKIMEGCTRHCTYCIIPKLRGCLRSRPAEDIAREARLLADQGAAEIVLVGQDTTSWGIDLKNQQKFSDLLKKVSERVPDVWLRFLYGHPDKIDIRLLETIAGCSNVCRYLDIPIQHASTRVLKRMGRNMNRKSLGALFKNIRKILPDAALRTTALVGFPGETNEDFSRLLKFVEQIEFDHLGAFIYSDAEDLPSHKLDGHVPAQTAQDRHDLLMMRQADISLAKNRQKIGQAMDVLVENCTEDGLFFGRSRFQAPEVDGVTFIKADSAAPGQIIRVRITDADEYDLTGVPV
jgi:ribosomal protein S12 methylthiotransferase